MENCRHSPPEELLRAIAQFNRGDWFECHDTLEELWVGAKGELRDFYQGVLQIAVALHHWRNGNLKGARILLQSGGDCLRRVPQFCLGVDVAGLVADAGGVLAALNELGEGRMSELPTELIPSIGSPWAAEGRTGR